VKKKIKEDENPKLDTKSKGNSTKRSKKEIKAEKKASKKAPDKSAKKESPPLSKKNEKKKRDSLLRANIKIKKRKSKILLILGVVFIILGFTSIATTAIAVLGKPSSLLDISSIITALLKPHFSFITGSTVGLIPTSVVVAIIGFSFLSIRKHRPFAIIQLFLSMTSIYTLKLLSDQAYTGNVPQYLVQYFENNNISPDLFSAKLIMVLICEVVLLMIISPICTILNEKYQTRLIKNQIEIEKKIIVKQKEAEEANKARIESERLRVKPLTNDSTHGIDIPIPIDVPPLTFTDKSKVYDVNPTKQNITQFSNVPDSTEPKISRAASSKKSETSDKKVSQSKDAVKDHQTVSLSTLELAKKNVEERMRIINGKNKKTGRESTLERATKDNSIPPLSKAVKDFTEPSKEEVQNVKNITNNFFSAKSSPAKATNSRGESRSSVENIMASGHLVNATQMNLGSKESAVKTKSNDSGSSISPFMNEILERINEPAKTATFENATVKNVNFSGGNKKDSKESGGGVSEKSFIDQLTTSMSMHRPDVTDVEVEDSSKSSDMPEIQSNQRYHAIPHPSESEIADMKKKRESAAVTSQLAGNGDASNIERPLGENSVAVGNYNSTAKPVGGARLVDEKEDTVKEVIEEEDDLESAIAGLGSSNVVESARIKYRFPPLDLVKDYPVTSNVIDETTKNKAVRLIETLAEFKYNVTLRNIVKGPTVTMFEIVPDPGIRVNSITNLSDNIAMNLAAEKVRILAPIPGQTAVGVEIPNPKRDIVGFKEILTKTDFEKMAIPMTIGRNLYGQCKMFDVATSPHMLVAGSTGSGKSVCINSLICSILYTRSPKDVRLIMVDPKVVELTIYNDIPHLLTPVITETKRALKALDFCIDEMERRNKMLARMNVRNIKSYNEKIKTSKLAVVKMPYIVVIIDEFASLMSTAGKDLDDRVARLTAMSRAVGIHLVFATQRPSVDVITGVIKNNLPTRIAFAVTSTQDSRTIISSTGAENLLGKGDMLLSENGKSVSRLQGVFLSDDEVENIVEFAKSQGATDYIDESYFESYEEEEDDSYDSSSSANDEDDLWSAALKIVTERKSASASFLQRRLRIGYNRAARLVEEMEEQGIVGPPNGSKPRELLRYPDLDNM
jgi:DNA segregation ATPase FtsK/SpoIIIE-like protein